MTQKKKAKELLKDMKDMLKKYHAFTMAEYKELIGVSHVYTDNCIGWIDLSKARITRAGDGERYWIVLPNPIRLDSSSIS